MFNFVSKLKLIQKINLSFYLLIISIISLVITFYFTSQYINHKIYENYNHILQVKNIHGDIEKSLKKLDYLAIHNSLEPIQDYKQKTEKEYKKMNENIVQLKNDFYFVNNKTAINLLQNIYQRINGYKAITSSLDKEMQTDFEDGVYAVLALTSASNVITKEMELLTKEIEVQIKKHEEMLKENILVIRLSAISIMLFFFVFLYILNKRITYYIISDLQKLYRMIESFFDYLAKKRKDIVHDKFDSKDEFAQIAHIIDSHMLIAKELVEQERKEALYIEQKVEEATKEIILLNNEIESTQREVVFTMGSIAEERSKETGKHVQRVAEYSLILARLCGLSLEESILLKNASPMHDIGKIAIPDAVLKKPGRFTDEEFEIMKSHAEIGYSMLKHSQRSILKAAAIVAYEHHEKWDGTGYPRGLKGEEIHIYGRITAIADVFDALGSERIYKKAWPLEKILSLFKEERGKQFDPDLIDIFLDNLEHFLAARENIDKDGDNSTLSHYIENFNASNVIESS